MEVTPPSGSGKTSSTNVSKQDTADGANAPSAGALKYEEQKKLKEQWEKEKKAEEASDAHKSTFDFVKEALGDKVKEVKASARLKSHPVCLTAGEGLSFEMEKYFQSVQPDSTIKADRIMELNVDHPVFQALETAVTADPDKAKKYAELLYSQALLIAGLPLEDPSGYTDLVCELMK